MNQTNQQQNSDNSNAGIPQWFKYLDILFNWRNFIIYSTLGSTIVALIVSLLLPLWYQASSVILLSTSNDLFGLSKLLGSGGTFEGFLGKNKTDDADRYEAIFKSERLRLAVINRFNLIHEYEFDEESVREPIRNTLKELEENISFKENKDGSIQISAWFKNDSVKAAEMANFVVTMMDSINRQLATESARNQRIFIERRYNQALEDLKTAEVNLNLFQKEFKVAEVSDQIRVTLEASAKLEASAVQSEVEYNILRRNLGDSNPQVIIAKQRIAEFRIQAKKFETGGGSQSDIIIPLNKAPDIAMSYLRLYRNVILETKILEFLVPQYEQAKIQEAKDTPNLLVLDRARVPEWKSKPKRLLIVAGTFISAFIISVFLSLGIELISDMKSSSPAIFSKFEIMWNTLRKRKN